MKQQLRRPASPHRTHRGLGGRAALARRSRHRLALAEPPCGGGRVTGTHGRHARQRRKRGPGEKAPRAGCPRPQGPACGLTCARLGRAVGPLRGAGGGGGEENVAPGQGVPAASPARRPLGPVRLHAWWPPPSMSGMASSSCGASSSCALAAGQRPQGTQQSSLLKRQVSAHLLRAAPPPELDVLSVAAGRVVVLVRRGRACSRRDEGGQQVVDARRRLLQQRGALATEQRALGRDGRRREPPHVLAEGLQFLGDDVTKGAGGRTDRRGRQLGWVCCVLGMTITHAQSHTGSNPPTPVCTPAAGHALTGRVAVTHTGEPRQMGLATKSRATGVAQAPDMLGLHRCTHAPWPSCRRACRSRRSTPG